MTDAKGPYAAAAAVAEPNKHAQLVTNIRDAVVEGLGAVLAEHQTQFAAELTNVNVLLGAIIARLEVLELPGSAAGAPKRAPRGERKTGAPAAAKPASTADDVYSKIKNARLYARRWFLESAEFRAKYASSDEFEAAAAADPKVSKQAEGSDEQALAKGLFLWDHFLTKPQKEEVTNEFKAWGVARSTSQIPPALEADEDDLLP